MTKEQMIETAEKIAANFAGNAWIKEEGNVLKQCRVYVGKGYCQITNEGVNLEQLNRNQFMDVKNFCAELQIPTYRAL